MKTLLPLLTAALLATALSSCGTVLTGKRNTVYFSSQPAGATVLVDGRPVGVTPCVVEVRDKPGKREITLEKQGYAPRSSELGNKFNAVTLVNLLWWPGFVVDGLTGAYSKVEYDRYHAELEDLPATIRRPEPTGK